MHFYMHSDVPASEMMATAETLRVRADLTQEALAKMLGMTQGHYSKLASGRVQPGSRSRTSITAWIAGQEKAATDPNARHAELKRLAADIVMQCMRLTELATQPGAS